MKSFLVLLGVALAASAAQHEARAPLVLTAERVYHSVIDQSPFLVEGTSTITWTQSPSITDSQPPPTQLPSDLPSGISISTPAGIVTDAQPTSTSSDTPVSTPASTSTTA